MKTGTRLDPILEDVRRRALERRAQRSLADLQRDLQPEPARRQRFIDALRAPGLSFIAECKRRSPSKGALSAEVDLGARAASYAAGGAAAISVLTEADHFGGSPADLDAARPAGLPLLRKDFILDAGMVLESVEMGADAILLLAVCLPDPLLAELRALAKEAGLAVLLEVHDEHELERALAVTPDCMGVNARDLKTFSTDLGVVERLLPAVPDSCIRVAESGLRGPADLARVRAVHADAALVGEALMTSGDPAATLRAWKEAHRV